MNFVLRLLVGFIFLLKSTFGFLLRGSRLFMVSMVMSRFGFGLSFSFRLRFSGCGFLSTDWGHGQAEDDEESEDKGNSEFHHFNRLGWLGVFCNNGKNR
jgi:hypothetical protein